MSSSPLLAAWLKPVNDFVHAALPGAPARILARGRALVLLAMAAPLLAFAISLPDAQLRREPLLLVLVGFAAVCFGLAPLLMRWARSLVWAIGPIVAGVAIPILVLVVVGHPRALAALVWLPALPLVGLLVAGRTGLLLAVFPALIVVTAVLSLPLLGAVTWDGGTAMEPLFLAISVLSAVLATSALLLLTAAEGDAARREADQSERRVQQARVTAAQTDRLAAVGMLATGVAHGVNNPLTAALDAALQLEMDLAEVAPPDVRRLRSLTSELAVALQQIRATVAALEAFSEPMGGDSDLPIDLEELVRSVVVAFRGSAPPGTQISMMVDTVLPFVGRRSETAQALLALLRNAVQSRGPGRAPVQVVITGGRTADDDVVLEIRDDGEGMDVRTLQRAFEPFFSTRGPGGGVGLGLSMARSVIEKMGGTLEVKSRLGHGTTARISLPAANVAYAVPAKTSTATPAVLHRARILVIDDDVLPLRVIGRALSERFVVTLEEDPNRALDRLLGREPFDLVITDVMMMSLTGDRLFEQVVAARPELAGRFLFVTGAVLGSDIRTRLGASGCPILRKPFGREQLLRHVTSILHERSVSPATLNQH